MNDERTQLQRELQQESPFPSPAVEAMVSLLKTADVIRRYFTQIVEPAGITLQQYNVLRILRGAGSDGLPTMAIGERMIEQTPGLTRLIDRLESKGLVSRERRADDRRQVFCAITQSGLDLLARLHDPMLEADEHTMSGLTPDRQQELVDLLAAVRKGCAC